MTNLDMTVTALAHRLAPCLSVRPNGKVHVATSKIAHADRVLLRRHWHDVAMRIFPHAYHRGELITHEQIERALIGSGDLDAYHTGKLTKRDALVMTKAWLTQVEQWNDLRWQGRRSYL